MIDHPSNSFFSSPLPPPVPAKAVSRTQTWILFLAICLLLGMFYGLSQVDGPALIIVHSLTYPLIDQLGDIGNELGEGETLVLISLVVGAVGLWRQSPLWKFAGLYMLLAHGLSGLITQLLKHTLGRPRPRHMDTILWDIGPSFESGLDSFPSGHTSASFSVATVLAYYFPRGRLLWFGLAGYVGICRVIKGSHFPTDVLGGLVIGIGSAVLLVYARDQWRKATLQAFVQGLPWLMVAFGLVWILVPHPGLELEPSLSFLLGIVLILIGVGFRLWGIRECFVLNISDDECGLNAPLWPRLLMGLGLATGTGDLVIVGASLVAGIIWWMGNRIDLTEIQKHSWWRLHPLWSEAGLGIGMGFLVLLTFSIRSQLLI